MHCTKSVYLLNPQSKYILHCTVQVLYVPLHNLQSMLSLQSALYKGRTYIVHNFQSIYTVQSTFEYLQCMTSLLQKWPRLMVPVLLNSHLQGKLGTKAATADLEGSSSTRRVPWNLVRLLNYISYIYTAHWTVPKRGVLSLPRMRNM